MDIDEDMHVLLVTMRPPKTTMRVPIGMGWWSVLLHPFIPKAVSPIGKVGLKIVKGLQNGRIVIRVESQGEGTDSPF